MTPEIDLTAFAGGVRLVGRLVEASNASFLVDLETGGQGIYKPVAGERPLWDFPDGTLAEREVAAYRISHHAGFAVVPETWLTEGPLGEGSVQRWLEDAAEDSVALIAAGDEPEGWFSVLEGVDQHERPVQVVHRATPDLRRIALFDAIVNNSDRKGAHLLTQQEKVWGVDHGVCFHADTKLRTVLWGWAGDPLTTDEKLLVEQALRAAESVDGLITPAEVDALIQRCTELLASGEMPYPSEDWPAIPWPPL